METPLHIKFGQEFIYIEGIYNDVADTMSYLDQVPPELVKEFTNVMYSDLRQKNKHLVNILIEYLVSTNAVTFWWRIYFCMNDVLPKDTQIVKEQQLDPVFKEFSKSYIKLFDSISGLGRIRYEI